MLFYFDGQGNSLFFSQEPIYQGSHNANDIWFVAPFSNQDTVTASVSFADGSVSQPFTLSYDKEIVGSIFPNQNLPFSVWRGCLANVITRNPGVLVVQFSVTNTTQTITTQPVSFTVIKGVWQDLSETVEESCYEEILRVMRAIREMYERTLSVDSQPTQNSTHLLTSGAIYQAVSQLQDEIKANQEKIGELYSGVTAEGNLVLTSVTQKYTSRTTGGGREVIDYSYSNIRTVSGWSLRDDEGGYIHAYFKGIESYSPNGEEMDVAYLPQPVQLAKWDIFDVQTGVKDIRTIPWVLDGTESWQKKDDYTYAFAIDSTNIDRGEVICNYEYGRSWGGWDTVKDRHILMTPYYLGFKDVRFEDVNLWQTHLSYLYSIGKPMTILVRYTVSMGTENVSVTKKRVKVWNNGREVVVQGDTDNSHLGAVNTVTQDYVTRVEG